MSSHKKTQLQYEILAAVSYDAAPILFLGSNENLCLY